MFRSKALNLVSAAKQLTDAGDYYQAIDLYTKAIHLCPSDYRFYLNRGLCYERVELYHWSLLDSEEAIRLNGFIEKCYLCKARALFGLKEYFKSEEIYRLVLDTNPNSIEAKEELNHMKFRTLKDFGFDKESALRAAINCETIRSAIDELLSQSVDNLINKYYINYRNSGLNLKDDVIKDKEHIEDIENRNFVVNIDSKLKDSQFIINNKFVDKNAVLSSNGVECSDKNSNNVVSGHKYSDKARNWANIVAKTEPTITKNKVRAKVETKSDNNYEKPTNIWGYNGIRAEKVNIDNKKAIFNYFSNFGKVVDIEPVPNRKNSVWIYYNNPNSPIEAIAKTQSTIKPNINYYTKGETQPLRLYFGATNDQKDLKFSRPKHPENDRGECYYWRTTTCLMDKCRLLHIPVNRHIDAQVWMKDMDGKPL